MKARHAAALLALLALGLGASARNEKKVTTDTTTVDVLQRLSEMEETIVALQRRISELESDVAQLRSSQRSAHRETLQTQLPWICKIQRFTESFTESGASEKVARAAVAKTCAAKHGEDMFCTPSKAECEQ